MPTIATMNKWQSSLDYAARLGIRIALEYNTPPLSSEQELALEALLIANERVKQEIEKEPASIL